MFHLKVLGLTLILTLFVLEARGQRKSERKGYNKQTGFGQLQGDSYSEIYKSTTRGQGASSSYSRLPYDDDDEDDDNDDDDDDDGGSGDGTNFDDDEDGGFDGEEEIGSGAFPTSFDPKGVDYSMTTTLRPSTSTTTSNSDLDIDSGDFDDEDDEGGEDDSDGDLLQGSGSGDFGSDDEDYEDLRSKSTSQKPVRVSTTTTTVTTTTITTTTITTTTSTTSTKSTTTSKTTTKRPTISPASTSTSTTSKSPKRTRPTFTPKVSTPKSRNDDDLDDGVEISIGQNHIIGVLLYSGLVVVLCLAILISLCLILRRKSGYSLANNIDEGSNSDSGSSDLPIIKQNSIIQDSKSHYARRISPGSPPPLMPPDLTLDENFFKGDKTFSSYGSRKSPSRLKSSSKYY